MDVSAVIGQERVKVGRKGTRVSPDIASELLSKSIITIDKTAVASTICSFIQECECRKCLYNQCN